MRWIATISVLALAAAMPAEARETQALADGWSFDFGIPDESPVQPGFDDKGWAKVAVPHTWNRLGNPGTARDATIDADRGMGWYRRTLCAPAAGKRSFLEFDAASIVADVYGISCPSRCRCQKITKVVSSVSTQTQNRIDPSRLAHRLITVMIGGVDSDPTCATYFTEKSCDSSA